VVAKASAGRLIRDDMFKGGPGQYREHRVVERERGRGWRGRGGGWPHRWRPVDLGVDLAVSEIVVQPRPDALLATGVTFGELAEVIGENVTNAGGGSVQLGGEQIAIRTDTRVQSPEEIANLPLKFRGAAAAPLLVRDVADPVDCRDGRAALTATAGLGVTP